MIVRLLPSSGLTASDAEAIASAVDTNPLSVELLDSSGNSISCDTESATVRAGRVNCENYQISGEAIQLVLRTSGRSIKKKKGQSATPIAPKVSIPFPINELSPPIDCVLLFLAC